MTTSIRELEITGTPPARLSLSCMCSQSEGGFNAITAVVVKNFSPAHRLGSTAAEVPATVEAVMAPAFFVYGLQREFAAATGTRWPGLVPRASGSVVRLFGLRYRAERAIPGRNSRQATCSDSASRAPGPRW